MDVNRMLDVAQRTGVSDRDLEDFERKASETAALIQALKDGTIAPEEVRVPGEKTEEELRAEQEARRKREEEARQRAEARARQERAEWWERAEALRGTSRAAFLEARRLELAAIVKGNESDGAQINARKAPPLCADEEAVTITDDDGNVLFPRPKEKTDALDYSKWDRWIPDDPVSLEEMQRAKDEIEEQRNQQFEAMNPEFCAQFKEDQAKRAAARQRKDKEAESHRQKGNLRFKKGLHEEALTEYAKALKAMPWSLPVLCNIAQTHLVRGDTDEALEYCERALFLEDSNVKALWRHARVCLKRGRLEEAVHDLTYAALLQPADREFARALAESRQDLLESYAENNMRVREAKEDQEAQQRLEAPRAESAVGPQQGGSASALSADALARELELLVTQTTPNVRVLKQMCKTIAQIDSAQTAIDPVAKLALDGMLECATEAKSESTQAEVHVLLRQTGALERLFDIAQGGVVRDARPYRLLACSAAASKVNREAMVQRGVLDAVLAQPSGGADAAVTFLHALSEHDYFRDLLARRSEVALRVQGALADTGSRAFSPAALLVANVGATPSGRDVFARASAAEPLGRALCAALRADRAAREDAAAALANLCQDVEFAAALAKAGSEVFEAVLDSSFDKHTPATVAFLLAALLNLTVDPAHPSRQHLNPTRCEVLADWSLDEAKPRVVRIRSAALWSRALTSGPQSAACTAQVSRAGGPPRLDGLLDLVAVPEIGEHAVRILAALLRGSVGSRRDPALMRKFAQKLAPPLREQAQAAELEGGARIQLAANLAQCFVQLTGEAAFCQQAFARETVIPALIKLLQFCENASVRKNVAISLAKLAKSSPENLAAIRALNGMRMLVELGGGLTA